MKIFDIHRLRPVFWVGLMLGTIWTSLACNSGRVATQRGGSDLDELMELMTGTFTSAQQARRNSDYYDIVLHMYPIWPEKGNWLYVEQAMASQPDQPYRQRIYRLEQVARGKFRSVVYTLPNPESYIGGWQEPSRFRKLSPFELELRSGCDVHLRKVGRQRYQGSTQGKNCASELRGAVFATSEVVVHDDLIKSWDRGFDEQGNQVWGATEGGYVFRRK